MGQVNRVDSCRLAVARAGEERAAGAVAASDAFFPFPDGLEVLLDAGVRAVVQPGGSMRDDEVDRGRARRRRDDVPHRRPALRALTPAIGWRLTMVRWEVPPERRLAFTAVLLVVAPSVAVTVLVDFRLGGYVLAAALGAGGGVPGGAARAVLPRAARAQPPA